MAENSPGAGASIGVPVPCARMTFWKVEWVWIGA